MFESQKLDAPLQAETPSGLGCFESVLDCRKCFSRHEEIPSVQFQTNSGKPAAHNKLNSLQSEEEGHVKDRIRAEKAKAVWKKLSRRPAKEDSNSVGFQKAADALIKAAKKREVKEPHDDAQVQLQSKMLENTTLESLRNRGRSDSASSSFFSAKSSESCSTVEQPLTGSPRPKIPKAPAGPQVKVDFESPAKATVGDAPHQASFLEEFQTSSFRNVRNFRNSVDSPQLTQSQALLAKLGGNPNPDWKDNSGKLASDTKRRSFTSARNQLRTPTRVKGEGKDLQSLKEEAYSILSQENQARFRLEKAQKGEPL